MAHQNYQVLRGITLPGKNGIVTGRVHNWLSELSDDIEPVSCWVLSLSEPHQYTYQDLPGLFKQLAWKLQANAGVNICLDGIETILADLKRFTETNELGTLVMTGVHSEDWKHWQSHFTLKYVADSLRLESEGSLRKFPNHISIYDSWTHGWYAILQHENTLLDFSQVREKDEYSTGRDSFIKLLDSITGIIKNPTLETFLRALSDINGTIKRGGFRKHGAVTVTLSAHSELIDEFLDIPFANLPYVKKAVEFNSKYGRNSLNSLENLPPLVVLKKCINKYNNGELFFDKDLGKNQDGVQLHSNVCRGISLVPGDQCLISHVNLGMIENVAEIPEAFAEVTSFLLNVFNLQQSLGFNNVDKQIAIGVVGLANCLRNFNINYPDFIEALFLWTLDQMPENWEEYTVYQLVHAINKGMHVSANLSDKAGMRACLTVEPSESCARRYKDYKGYDLCPNIDPPDVAPGIGVERRHSGTGIKDEYGNEIHPVFNYGADIPTASELSTDEHFALWEQWQKTMERTRMSHMGSYEHWNKPLDVLNFYKWFNSDIKTLYYYRTIGTKHLQKGSSIINARRRYQQTVEQAIEQKIAGETCSVISTCESCSD